jgi:hypothetical protein
MPRRMRHDRRADTWPARRVARSRCCAGTYAGDACRGLWDFLECRETLPCTRYSVKRASGAGQRLNLVPCVSRSCSSVVWIGQNRLPRRTLTGSRGSRSTAKDPLLPRDAGIDRDPPVEAKSAPFAGGSITRIGRQLEHVGMFSGQPMDQFLLFLGQRELNRQFGAAQRRPPGSQWMFPGVTCLLRYQHSGSRARVMTGLGARPVPWNSPHVSPGSSVVVIVAL